MTPWIYKTRQSSHAIRGYEGEYGHQRGHPKHTLGEDFSWYPSRHENGQQDHHQHYGGSKVGLLHHEHNCTTRCGNYRAQDSLESYACILLVGDEIGDVERKGELHEFRRLDTKRSVPNPAT